MAVKVLDTTMKSVRRTKDLLSSLTTAVIVQPVRPGGLTTTGSIEQIAAAWPHAYEAYTSAAKNGMKLGNILMTRARIQLSVCYLYCLDDENNIVPGAMFVGAAELLYRHLSQHSASVHIVDQGAEAMKIIRQMAYFVSMTVHPSGAPEE